MSYSNKVCWVTGSSSGIGAAIAAELATQGAHLILSARDKEKLDKVAKNCLEKGASGATVIPLDLASESSVKNAVEQFKSKFERIDLLINNGGISQRSLSVETNFEVEKNIMQVNYFGAILLTKLLLPMLIEQKEGHLAVTSSIVGKFGFPLRTTYSASKHAVQGYFESLRVELERYNIKVSIIIPGRVRTEISKHALDGSGAHTNKMDQGLEDGISPTNAANKIVRGLYRGKKEILVGGKELLLVHIRRLLPRLYYKMVSKISPT